MNIFKPETRIISFVAILIAVSFFSSDYLYARIELRFSTIAMDGSPQMEAFRAAGREIEELTDGAVRIRMYTGGAMGTGDRLFRSIRLGQLDGGSFTAGEASTYSQDMRALSVSFLFESYDEVDYVFPKVSDHLRKVLRDKGWVVLSFVEAGFGYLMSVDPVRSAADLYGRNVWVPSDDWVGQAAFREFGVVPRPLSLANASTGLMTGMVDVVGGPFMAAVGLQWINRVRYVFDHPLLYTYGVLLISEAGYNRIPEEYRETVVEVFERHQSKYKATTREANREARQAMENRGIKFISPSDEELASWPEKIDDAKESIRRSGRFSEGLLEKIENFIDEFRELNGE